MVLCLPDFVIELQQYHAHLIRPHNRISPAKSPRFVEPRLTGPNRDSSLALAPLSNRLEKVAHVVDWIPGHIVYWNSLSVNLMISNLDFWAGRVRLVNICFQRVQLWQKGPEYRDRWDNYNYCRLHKHTRPFCA